MTKKEKYIQFCKQNDFVPVFSQPWWMDAVCIDGYWDVLLYEKKREIVGALPYYVKKKWGLSYITQPKLNAMTGLVIKYPNNQKFDKKISFENDILLEITKQLESLSVVFFQQTLHCKYTNWLGFYWSGCKQTTHYNYAHTGLLGKAERDLLASYASSKRQDVKTALVKGLYLDERAVSAEEFYDFHSACLEKQNRKIQYPFRLLSNMIGESVRQNAGRLFVVRDARGRLAAVSFVVWDNQAAYVINTAIDHDQQDAGALIYHEELKYFSGCVNTFYFSGSMMEGVEATYRRFSNVQMPCLSIRKVLTRDPLLKLLFRLKGL